MKDIVTDCPVCSTSPPSEHGTADVFMADEHVETAFFKCRACGTIGDPATGQAVKWPSDKPLVKNIKACSICQSPVDRFPFVFKCRNPKCGAVGDLNTGILIAFPESPG